MSEFQKEFIPLKKYYYSTSDRNQNRIIFAEPYWTITVYVYLTTLFTFLSHICTVDTYFISDCIRFVRNRVYLLRIHNTIQYY